MKSFEQYLETVQNKSVKFDDSHKSALESARKKIKEAVAKEKNEEVKMGMELVSDEITKVISDLNVGNETSTVKSLLEFGKAYNLMKGSKPKITNMPGVSEGVNAAKEVLKAELGN